MRREQQSFKAMCHRLSLTMPIVMILFLVLFCADNTMAVTRYVKPSGEAVVRTGQGNQYKIVGVVKEGNSVEMVEENEDYALVRLSNGVEGWMLRRFLKNEPPLDALVDQLRKEKEVLQQKETEATLKIEEMTTMLETARTDLDMLVAERDKVVTDFQTLQRDTADVMKIRNDMQKTAEENRQLVEKIVVLEAENNQMKKDRTVNWFLAGGGVLVFGIALGKMPSPSRRRKSSLLS
ncbi:SH3 domain protein [Desulfopila aestuarii DSM 18488]|uniref:SH3 domain protein n=2 Tax=Desulfopila aestuarii TaxID=231440 RepID=A0A1M7YAH4_9BACT|nr:SH3 domain protein [Desulfopila aestuarii DSM 18488]